MNFSVQHKFLTNFPHPQLKQLHDSKCSCTPGTSQASQSCQHAGAAAAGSIGFPPFELAAGTTSIAPLSRAGGLPPGPSTQPALRGSETPSRSPRYLSSLTLLTARAAAHAGFPPFKPPAGPPAPPRSRSPQLSRDLPPAGRALTHTARGCGHLLRHCAIASHRSCSSQGASVFRSSGTGVLR